MNLEYIYTVQDLRRLVPKLIQTKVITQGYTPLGKLNLRIIKGQKYRGRA